MISIPLRKNDDPRFLALVRRSVSGSVLSCRPSDVFVIRIDHWFDHKWFAFAGKLLGGLAFHKPQRLTVPPFIPERVVSEDAFKLGIDRASYHRTRGPRLHRYQHSGENLSRFIGHISKSAVFIWFSGDTAHEEHGSIMVYSIQGETQGGWYGSFRRRTDWQLHKVQGLSRSELMGLIERDFTVPLPAALQGCP